MQVSRDILGNNKYVYLYAAQGADSVCVKHTQKSFNMYLGSRACRLVTLSDASYISKIKDAAAVVVPGGSAATIAQTLAEDGKQKKISEIVNKQNAAYMGFCAGAYLASKTMYNFDGFYKEFDFGLSLNRGPVIYGPAFDLESSPSNNTATAVKVNSRNESLYTFWNGGGWQIYDMYDDMRDVAAKYTDRINSSEYVSAAVHKIQSSPNIIFSHVHPEIRLTKEEIERDYPNFKNKEGYLNSIERQEMLFGTICEMAGITQV